MHHTILRYGRKDRTSTAILLVPVRQRSVRVMWARMPATPDLTVYVAEESGGEIVGTTSLLVPPDLTYDCRKVQVVSHKGHAGDGAYAFYQSLGFQGGSTGIRLYLRPTGTVGTSVTPFRRRRGRVQCAARAQGFRSSERVAAAST
ncbi:MAG TPA: hypothetical protein VNT52_08715, partial [Acidimicrobiales bacterium]|nr:hypothetical protein [Acidimicrobiales bacterium]